MNFLVLAIDHNWQLVPQGDFDAARAKFQEYLLQVILDSKIDLICEESDPCRLSIAQKMAHEHQPRIPWRNIIMSAQERLEAGVWDALMNRPVEQIQEAPGILREIDTRIPEDDVREEFFCKQAIDAAATGAKSGLVLCGDMHADAVSKKLQAHQCQSKADHTLIEKKYWR
jgi:hypothetical protein